MSDYPRPPVPAPTPRFLLDRVVGGGGFLYFAFSAVAWMVAAFRDSNARTFFRNNPSYILFYLSLAVVYLWGFLLVFKGRRGGFITVAILLIFTMVGAFFAGRVASSIPYFAVWAYCVARLSGLLGPKPAKS